MLKKNHVCMRVTCNLPPLFMADGELVINGWLQIWDGIVARDWYVAAGDNNELWSPSELEHRDRHPIVNKSFWLPQGSLSWHERPSDLEAWGRHLPPAESFFGYTVGRRPCCSWLILATTISGTCSLWWAFICRQQHNVWILTPNWNGLNVVVNNLIIPWNIEEYLHVKNI
jgi:hypothetical protein